MFYNNFKGRRSCQLRPKAHILDDPLGNPYDGLKVLFGPKEGPVWPLFGPINLRRILHLPPEEFSGPKRTFKPS